MSNVDIERMAKKTGIAKAVIAKALEVVYPVEVTTLEQALEAYRDTKGIKNRKPAMKKLLSFCITLKQAREAYNSAPSESEEARLAMKKWREFSAEAVAKAKTFKQAKNVYRTVHGWNEGRKLAFTKLLSFCTTLEQAREAYREVPVESEEAKLAIIKIASFFPI